MKLNGVSRYDKQLLNWFNIKLGHRALDRFFEGITHLGGATWTISFTLAILLIAPDPWKTAAWSSLLALTISHIIVAITKRTVVRIRPYMIIPNIRVGKVKFKDHSFPSGHTTAIFSVVTPFILIEAWLSLVLLPIALVVAMSRVYLGMHYPSDCAAGIVLGSLTAIVISFVIY